MAFEADFSSVIKGVCVRSFPDFLVGTVTPPYIIWQSIGGESLRYGDNTAPDKRNTLMQISAWAKTRAEALALIRSIEDAVCASPKFLASPEGEPVSDCEPDIPLYGSIQRFSIWFDR